MKSFSFSNNSDKENNKEDSKSDSDSDSDKSQCANDLFLDKTQTRHGIYRVVRPIDDYIYRSTSLMIYHYMNFIVKYID